MTAPSPEIAALLAACRDLFAAPTYEDYCVREIRTLAEAYAAYEAAEAAPIQPAPGVGCEMSELERWENEAAAFYKATGYLRPGKDYAGMAFVDERIRQELWKAWVYGRDYRLPPPPKGDVV